MKKILALTLVLVMVLALCACGSSKMAGTWELTAMINEGEDYMPVLQEYGTQVVLQLNENGTGYFDVGGKKTNITWSGNSIITQGKKERVKLSGDTLTIKGTDAVMTFTRK